MQPYYPSSHAMPTPACQHRSLSDYEVNLVQGAELPLN